MWTARLYTASIADWDEWTAEVEAAVAAGATVILGWDRFQGAEWQTLYEPALSAALADVPELALVKIPEGYRHVFHQFVVHFDGSAFGKNRDDLLDFLTAEAGIRAIVITPSIATRCSKSWARASRTAPCSRAGGTIRSASLGGSACPTKRSTISSSPSRPALRR